jgi:predicted nucleic acid-binding Zn finger protein
MKQKEQSETEKAMDLLKDQRVFEFDDIELENHFKVVGKTGTYLVVLPNFCTCDQFVFRCLKTPEKVCYHILAAKFATKSQIIDKDEWENLIFSN